MTPEELKSIRQSLRLSHARFAKLVRVSGEKTVRRWELPVGAPDKRDIPGPVMVLAEALRDSRAVRRYFGVATEADSTANSE